MRQKGVGFPDPISGTLNDVRNALDLLPSAQREAVVLVGAAGMSYEEAAQVRVARSEQSRAVSIAAA